MASLQAVRVKGHTYWRIVESRRVNGKPRPVPILYLGKADDLLARLRAADAVSVRSLAHGDVAALYALALELDVAGTIDRCLAASGRRSRGPGLPARPPLLTDGLSVGQSLTLAAIGRACHPTSKRGQGSPLNRSSSTGGLLGAGPGLAGDHMSPAAEAV